MGKHGADGDKMLMMEWAFKDLTHDDRGLKRSRGSLQSSDRHGIGAQNRMCPRALESVTDLLPSHALGIITRLAMKKV